LAYYESTEYVLEETESEVLNLKQQKIQGEKQLIEKRRYLDKCKQVNFCEGPCCYNISQIVFFLARRGEKDPRCRVATGHP
jgi:hypothetical protein